MTLMQRMERERLRQKRADLAGGRLKRLLIILAVLLVFVALVGLIAGP